MWMGMLRTWNSMWKVPFFTKVLMRLSYEFLVISGNKICWKDLFHVVTIDRWTSEISLILKWLCNLQLLNNLWKEGDCTNFDPRCFWYFVRNKYFMFLFLLILSTYFTCTAYIFNITFHSWPILIFFSWDFGFCNT